MEELGKKVTHKLVQMRLRIEEIKKVNDLLFLRGTKNKVQIVAEAISIFHIVCDAIVRKNADIIIKYPNGTSERIILL